MPNTPAGIPPPAGTDRVNQGDDAIHNSGLACAAIHADGLAVTVAANQRTVPGRPSRLLATPPESADR
jgi:hypothetical protein